MARPAADKTNEPDMDEGRFAPIGDDGVIEGEIVQSTERALATHGPGTDVITTGLISLLAKAEMDQMIATARALPRDMTGAEKQIRQLAIWDPETAGRCGYVLPRGKDPLTGKQKAISGPSVKLARITASRWGNCRAESRPLEINREEAYVEAAGIFHDYETNYLIKATVRRSIRGKPWQGKPGRIFSDDMINVTAMAASAIAFRNAVFGGIPEPIYMGAYQASLDVVRGDLKTLVPRRLDLILAYKERLNIPPESLFKILGVKGEMDIGLDELAIAAGFYSGLKNNEITMEDLLKEAGAAAPVTPKTLGGAFGTEGAKPPASKPAATPSHDPKTGEVIEPKGPTAGSAKTAAPEGPTSGSATPAPADTQDQADSGHQEADDSSNDGEEEEDEAMGDAPAIEEESNTAYVHVAGTENTDPRAFLLWAPTAFPADRKPAFTKLSRTPAYKALDEGVRDMIAAAVTGEEQTPATAKEKPKAEAKPEPEADRITVGHADAGEVYFMADSPRPADGKRATFKDGAEFSSSKGNELRVFAEHPPAPAAEADPEEQEEEPESSDWGPGRRQDVATFWDAIAGQESWLPIKAQVAALYKTGDWTERMDAAEQRTVRIAIWHYVDGLVKAKKDPLDFATDPSAFRLWIEVADDPDAIIGNYNVLKREPVYGRMKQPQVDSLDAVVNGRINDLRKK